MRPAKVINRPVPIDLLTSSAALARPCLLLGVTDMPFELTTPGAVLFARVFGVFTAKELNHLATEAEIAEAYQPVSLDRITDLTAVERFEVGFREIYGFAIRRSAQTQTNASPLTDSLRTVPCPLLSCIAWTLTSWCGN